MDCKFKCGRCRDGMACHHVTGRCVSGCEPGFTGQNCNNGKVHVLLFHCFYIYLVDYSVLSVGRYGLQNPLCLSYKATKWGGPSNDTAKTEVPCHSRCGIIKIPPCSIDISAKQWQKFYSSPPLHGWHIADTALNPKQSINQTNDDVSKYM